MKITEITARARTRLLLFDLDTGRETSDSDWVEIRIPLTVVEVEPDDAPGLDVAQWN